VGTKLRLAFEVPGGSVRAEAIVRDKLFVGMTREMIDAETPK
jgi:hypothetical protein